MTHRSPTAAVAAFACHTGLDAISEPTREVARECILDALACALAGTHARVTRAARTMAGNDDRGATVWGTRVRCAPDRAAFANGTAAHAVDYDDVSWAMNGHPTAPLLPAVLAVAEACGASGRDAFAAFVIGFEVQARIGEALTRSHYARGWHPTSTLGALGATVAAGRLLGLDEPAMRRAIGIACSRLSGSRMNFGTDTKPLHCGFAAQIGVTSAHLADAGVTAREDGLECEMGLAALYDGARPMAVPVLGAPYAFERPGVEFKLYPSCRFTHRAIDATLALRDRLAGTSFDMTAAALTCEIEAFAENILIYYRPENGLEAKFCMPYCVAVAWLDGRPTLASFSDERARADDVRALMNRVTVRYSEREDDAVTAAHAGSRHTVRVRHARGSPANPLGADERLAKVRDCASALLGDAGVDALIAAVISLDRAPDLTALVAALTVDE